jgi:methylmalonyl-CoA mutase cobalamin-binding domain/chain
MEILEEIQKNLISGKYNQVAELTQSALDSGLAPNAIINDGFISAMEIVGKRFKAQEIWVPEVLMAAKSMHMGMDVLAPLIEKGKGQDNIGKIVIGTVQTDVHDIGKNLVRMMLSGTGFEVVDIGVNMPPQKFVDAAIAEEPDIIGMSALLSTAIPKVEETVTALKQAGIKKPFKTIIGGAAVSQQIADDSGADAYAEEAGIAVEKAKDLMKQLT